MVKALQGIGSEEMPCPLRIVWIHRIDHSPKNISKALRIHQHAKGLELFHEMMPQVAINGLGGKPMDHKGRSSLLSTNQKMRRFMNLIAAFSKTLFELSPIRTIGVDSNNITHSKGVVDPESWTQRETNLRKYNVFKRREHEHDNPSQLYTRVQSPGRLRGINGSQERQRSLPSLP